jgi:hypothetical protein
MVVKMFEITKDQIKQLKDDELRELISLLSESTLRKYVLRQKQFHMVVIRIRVMVE